MRWETIRSRTSGLAMYTITEVLQTGYVQTAPASGGISITTASGTNLTAENFGVIQAALLTVTGLAVTPSSLQSGTSLVVSWKDTNGGNVADIRLVHGSRHNHESDHRPGAGRGRRPLQRQHPRPDRVGSLGGPDVCLPAPSREPGRRDHPVHRHGRRLRRHLGRPRDRGPHVLDHLGLHPRDCRRSGAGQHRRTRHGRPRPVGHRLLDRLQPRQCVDSLVLGR